MSGRVSPLRTRRPRVKLSKPLQATLLDAVARKPTDPEPSFARTLDRPSPKPTEDFAEDAGEIRARKKRRLDRAPDGREEALPQPRPHKPQQSYASFLKEFVDPPYVGSDSCPSSLSTWVSDWLETAGAGRQNHSRSDSHLHVSGSDNADDDPAPRHRARSAPVMASASTQDADGFVRPETPASQAGFAQPLDGGSTTLTSSGKSLVEDRDYRMVNLAENHIYMRYPWEIPEHVTSIVEHVRRDRDSPAPSLEDVMHDDDLRQLAWMGAGEPVVAKYFSKHVFPDPGSGDSLQRSDRIPMVRRAVPNSGSPYRVSTPVPDLLYGYQHPEAFPQRLPQFLATTGGQRVNGNRVLYPFFVVEFKGDDGSLWAATNQCIGGSVSCVHVAEQLNRQLRARESDQIQPINSAAFSIAMNGTEARLHITWKHDDLEYSMAEVKHFLLQDPEQHIDFRKYVRNIVDWGQHQRLSEIQKALDSLLEADRIRAAKAAKSRPPPAGDPTSSRKKRRA